MLKLVSSLLHHQLEGMLYCLGRSVDFWCKDTITLPFLFFWYISIYFLLIINTFVISIVSYKRTLVNSETTSSDTILYSRGIVILWSPFVNVLLLLIVNCDSLNGFRSWARYLAKSYVAVLLLEMIGLSGRCSSVLLFETLCSLAVW